MRSPRIFPALTGGAGYPLATAGLSTAGAAGSLVPGGAGYYRFAVAANATASLTLTPGTAGAGAPLQGVVVRIR